MIDSGMRRIHAQLEVDNFIRTMLQVKVVLRTLFNKAERFFLNNHQTFMINSSVSSSDDSSILTNDCKEKQRQTEFLLQSKYSGRSPYFDSLLRDTMERQTRKIAMNT